MKRLIVFEVLLTHCCLATVGTCYFESAGDELLPVYKNKYSGIESYVSINVNRIASDGGGEDAVDFMLLIGADTRPFARKVDNWLKGVPSSKQKRLKAQVKAMLDESESLGFINRKKLNAIQKQISQDASNPSAKIDELSTSIDKYYDHQIEIIAKEEEKINNRPRKTKGPSAAPSKLDHTRKAREVVEMLREETKEIINYELSGESSQLHLVNGWLITGSDYLMYKARLDAWGTPEKAAESFIDAYLRDGTYKSARYVRSEIVGSCSELRKPKNAEDVQVVFYEVNYISRAGLNLTRPAMIIVFRVGELWNISQIDSNMP